MPPSASSKIKPVHPCSARWPPSLSEYGSPFSIIARTASGGHSCANNSRADDLNSFCVSFRSKSMSSPSITLRQAEHEVADDVALNLAGAGFDGIAARPQVAVRPFAVIDGRVAGGGQLAVGAEHLHRHLLQALIHLAPEDFLNRAFGAGHACLAHARQ